MSIQTREVQPDDLSEIVELFNRYRVFYEQESDLESCREFIQERLEKGDSVIFIAYHEADPQKLLGFVQLYPSFSSVAMRRVWILNDLYVHPDARQQGVAQSLMNRAAEFSRSTGAVSLLLETQTKNKPAQALYDKLGYEKDVACYHYALKL